MGSESEILITAGAIFMLVGAAMAHAIDIYKIGFLHESGLYIILGLFGGSLWLWLSPSDTAQFSFSSDIFFDVILPPIIFSAGYNLKNKQFINNFSPIMVLAILGALLNFLLMSSIAIATGGYGLEDSECMLFAALMSATDGVAVVALIDSDAFPTIFGTLIGEGCINDAVAIILYASIDTISTQNSGFAFTAPDLWYISVKVCEIAFFSILVGVGVGLGSSLYFKYIRIQASPKTELTLLFLFGYLSYSINDSAGMSGIIGVFFCGVIMSHYTFHSLTTESQHASREMFEALSYAGETFIYLSLGFYVFSYTNSGNWNVDFLIVMLLVLILGRVLIVGICVGLINVCRKGPRRIGLKTQAVFVWGGIVRGSICFALSLRKETTHSPIIVTTTFMIVILTTFAIGSLTDTFLRCIGMKDDHMASNKKKNRKTTVGSEDRGRFRYYLKYFDERWMKPCFGGRKRRIYELSEDNPLFEASFYNSKHGKKDKPELSSRVSQTVHGANGANGANGGNGAPTTHADTGAVSHDYHGGGYYSTSNNMNDSLSYFTPYVSMKSNVENSKRVTTPKGSFDALDGVDTNASVGRTPAAPTTPMAQKSQASQQHIEASDDDDDDDGDDGDDGDDDNVASPLNSQPNGAKYGTINDSLSSFSAKQR